MTGVYIIYEYEVRSGESIPFIVVWVASKLPLTAIEAQPSDYLSDADGSVRCIVIAGIGNWSGL